MSILITGVAGFIGSHTAGRLLSEKESVIGIDCFRPYYDRAHKEANLKPLLDFDGFEFIEGDLSVMDLAPVFAETTSVLHLSAQPGVRASWDRFSDYSTDNIAVTQRLLEAARGSVDSLVYASSSSIYGNARGEVSEATTIPRPYSPYGVSKLAAEHLCSLYAHNYGLATRSLRYFTVYGPGQRPDMLIQRLIAGALLHKAVPLYGSGSQVRSFTHVDDVVTANCAALRESVPAGEIINIAGNTSASILEVATMVEEACGKRVEFARQTNQAGDVEEISADTSLAGNLLSWTPVVNLQSGIASQVDHARERHALVG